MRPTHRLLTAVTAALIFGLAGCGAPSTGDLQPELTLSATKLDFGEVPDGGSSPLSVQLTNSGGSAATDLSVTVQGTDTGTSVFAVDASACLPELRAGASCPISVQVMAAKPVGPQTAELQVTSSNSDSPPAVALTATVGCDFYVYVQPAQGPVTSMPPIGLQCNQQCASPSGCVTVCSTYVFAGTSVTVDVALPPGYDAIWSLECANPFGASCNLVVTQDSVITADIGPQVSVQLTRDDLGNYPWGILAVGPPGLFSTEYCAYATCPLIWSGPLQLVGILQNTAYSGGGVLLNWDGACAGAADTCNLNVTGPTQLGAHFQALNQVFTTGPVPISSFGVDGAGADAACNTAALALGYSQPFVAWLAATGRNPATLLAGTNGWSIDGAIQTFAPDVASITGARLWTPLYSSSAPVVTGAAVDGSPLPATLTCQSWTATSGVTPAGTLGAIGYAWSNDPGIPPLPCSGSANLVCFGLGRSGAIATSRFPDAGVTFLSGPWVPSNGLPGADGQCQSDAQDAGYSGAFIASELHGVTTNPTPPDLRADGAPVVTADNVDSHGLGIVATTLSETYVWTVGTESCDSWAGGVGTLGSVRRFDLGSTELVPPADVCSAAHRLVCQQTQ